MANEVKIKLTADSNQVKQQIKLIDQQLEGLGNSASPSFGNSSTVNKESSSVNNTKSMNKIMTLMLREMIELRKSIERQHNPSSSPTKTVPTSTGSSPTIVATGGGGGAGGNGVFAKLGKLLGVATAVGGVARGLGNFADKSSNAQETAYNTYGRTGWYSDYGKARQDNHIIGIEYGYNYNETMTAGSAFMKQAGFTTKEAYQSDMDAMLKTSRAFGLDQNEVARTGGIATKSGMVGHGEQEKFAKLLAKSIVEAGMGGREQEQLQVIAGLLEDQRNKTGSVTEEQINKKLAAYNALVNENPEFKGQMGSDIVKGLERFAQSNNQAIKVARGLGTTYNGASGQWSMMLKAEQDPMGALEEFFNASHIQSLMGTEEGRALIKETAYNEGMGSRTQIEKAFNTYLKDGTLRDFNTDNKGIEEHVERRQQKLLEEYQESGVHTDKQHKANQENAEANAGDEVNRVNRVGREVYNQSGTTAQTMMTIGGIAVPSLLAGGALHKAGQWLGNRATSTGLPTATSAVPKGVGAKPNYFGNTLKLATPSIGKTLGRAAMPVVLAYETYDTYSDVNELLDQGQHKDAVERTGAGVGGIAGMLAGAKLGAMGGGAVGAAFGGIGAAPGAVIGAILGGAAGAFGGSWLGEGAGGIAADALGVNNQSSEPIEDNTKSLDNVTSDLNRNTKATEDNTKAILSKASSPTGSHFQSILQDESIKRVHQDGTTTKSGFNKDRFKFTWRGFGNTPKAHATGNDYVPHDNYAALLHKGEMVLTASEAKEYKKPTQVQATNSTISLNINLTGAIQGMDASNQNLIVQAVVSKIKQSNLQSMLSDGFTRRPNI